ncbi:hypothetical protein BsWGS_07585 [Bradybaena similaris]
MQLVKSVKASWKTLVVLVTPLALCPMVFPFSDTSLESRCAALIILMAVYWITESLPLPLTSLLPIALCPLLGVASSKQMCAVIFGDTSFLMLGGFIVAIAVEECQLHKRFALKILVTIGVEPRRLMLGVMVTTAFLSMWINNAATTAMMLTITRALLVKLFMAYKITQRRLVQDSSQDQGSVTAQLKSSTDYPLTPSTPDGIHDISQPNGSSHFIDRLTFQEHEEPGDTANGQLRYRHEDHHKAALKHEDPDILIDEAKEDIDFGDDQDEGETIFQNLDSRSKNILKAFGLCVCYSANIGGMATLTGCMSNMVLSAMSAEMSNTTLVTFTNWLSFSLPVTILTLTGAYFWMRISVFGLRNTFLCRAVTTDRELKLVTESVQQEYRKLGNMRFNEVIVLIHFVLLVLLWVTRDLGTVPGWSILFQKRFVSESSAALLVATSLFIFPNHRPNVLFFRRNGDMSPPTSAPSILKWKQTCRKFPWSVLFLIGGGFALTEATRISGLSKIIAGRLTFIQNLPMWVASLVVTAVTSLVTEITSNTVVVLLLLPILKDIAVALAMNPMYLMLSATLASSLAFMLPVSTPPNALVFSYGDLKTTDMIKTGVVLNIIGVLVIVLAVNTWGFLIYDLGEFPSWAVPAGIAEETVNATVISTMFTNVTRFVK